MNTLARAAIERDKAMEDGEEMQLLSGKEQEIDGSRLNTIQRNRHTASSCTNTMTSGGKQRVTFEDIDGGSSSATLVANSPRYVIIKGLNQTSTSEILFKIYYVKIYHNEEINSQIFYK